MILHFFALKFLPMFWPWYSNIEERSFSDKQVNKFGKSLTSANMYNKISAWTIS